QFFSELEGTIPVIFGGRPFHPEQHSNYFVDVDNAAGAALATEHLMARGRRHIATIAGPADMQAAVDRTTGWGKALSAAGLPTGLIAYGDFTMASGATAMRALLERDPHLDGVFAASDLMAIGALAVLRERGIAVPDDVSVVGFDDSPAATSSELQLTTVHQPSTEMGLRMANNLLALLGGEDVERQSILPTRLVVRDSA
ncbi:MAG: substrate-binding domain-containing protein, partial [Burkholderiaceae bacterium]|nr:substrate-binding domain-containing protein [Microbacteriaceae bacterium]